MHDMIARLQYVQIAVEFYLLSCCKTIAYFLKMVSTPCLLLCVHAHKSLHDPVYKKLVYLLTQEGPGKSTSCSLQLLIPALRRL